MSRKDKFKRMCIICREYKNKEDLLRYTRDYETGEILENTTSQAQGRSVYICKDGNCLDTAKKKQRIEQALKHKK
ncbi:YlxR family protein [bacterium]|nr:YlxR family protein [bacterium]